MSGLAPAPLAPTTLAPTTFAPGRAYAPAAAFPATAPAAGIAPAGAMATAGGATYSATTTQAVNLRTGPGTGYDVLATLPAGTAVGVRGCTGSWCETVDGYVSARHLSGAAIGQSVGQAQAARVIVRPAPARAVASSRPTYADPMLASDVVPAGYEVTAPYPGPVYPGIAVPPAYPVGGAILAGLAAPFIGIAAAVDAVDGYGGYGYGYGTAPFGYGWGTAWRASWGPGYWGPGLYGRNGASYWGARTSYWGGRPSYANMHPGYPNIARFGDRNGDTYWSRRGEGRLPQRASFYSGLGPRWQGPYAAGPSYNGRPVMWRPRAARW
ncbi:SH3 domain-containing protein [Ancylobacter sp. VKM B-3255]|uniref:SH3 domain-containing protein n=2 Tax=Ancylobacter radicis TaxID=2836179 RepID=A0ABS5R282_9HYPH|nr:SH3 domain-containing protein [Ancylobacter radicis]